MSNSSGSSPVNSTRASVTDETESDLGYATGEGGWWGDGQPSQLKVLEANDQVRELQTIIRDL